MAKQKTAFGAGNNVSLKKKPRGKGKPFEAGNPYRLAPGQSGNPSGRPRGPMFATRFYEYAERPIADLARLMALAVTAPEKLGDLPMIDVMVLRAMAQYMHDTNGAIFNAIFDRVEGKPVQPIEQLSDDEVREQLRDLAAILAGTAA